MASSNSRIRFTTMKIASRKILCGACVAVCLIFYTAQASAERLPLRAYTTTEGLPHNLINKIVRDSRGFLWFCTGDGLSRFDGYTFTNFTTDHGLPHRNVTDFVETRNGEFWVGTNAGLVRFNPQGFPSKRVIDVNDTNAQAAMFAVVPAPDSDRQANAVNVLLQAREGTIWCGTMKHLYRLQRTSSRFALLRVELGASTSDIHVLDLLEDQNGSLWIASFGWLSRRWPDGSTARYSVDDGIPDVNIHDVFQDDRGRLWAATRDHGFFQFTADTSHATPVVVRTYSERDGLGTLWVSQILETSDHRFWIATNRGIAEFYPDAGKQESSFKTYNQRNGLLYQGTNTLSEDVAANLWIGTDGGAMKLARQGFISYDEQDGLSVVTAIFANRKGNVCFRGAVLGDEHVSAFEGAKSDLSHPLQKFYSRLGCFDGKHFMWLKPDVLAEVQLGWVGEMVTLQRRNGEWWVGTGIGVYRFPVLDDFAQLKHARPLAVYSIKDGLTASQTFRLFEDSRGDIWESSILPNGVARFDAASQKWHDVTKARNMPPAKDNLARSFAEDVRGNVWIGFDTGVARYRNGEFVFFTKTDGFPEGALQNIYSDRAGRLWLVSSRSGLIRVDDPNAEHPVFKVYTTAEGLSSNTTEGITEDLHGHIYVGTGRGLDRLDPASGQFRHFTSADGLAPGRIIAGFRDSTGALWFGTANGLSRIVPSTDEVAAAPPPIMITEVSISGQQRTVSAMGETQIALNDIAADRSQLRIGFVGLSFATGEVLRYQLKLEGADSDWSAPTEQRSVTYPRLAPGSYQLLIRALDSDGAVSPQPAIVTFTILPPIWQRWWFVALILAAIAVVVYLLYRYRVARIVELANVRTRIATDLHDDIGTNLTKIAILSEVVKQQHGNGGDADADPLSSIARISRESVAAMGDIVWAINPQRDNFVDLVRRMRQHAEEVCLAQDIDLQFNAPPSERELKLNVDVRRDLYLIFKEAVNNAIRHSACSRLQIEIRADERMLCLAVRDNGKGFDAATTFAGNGLMNMRRRVQAHNGTINVQSHTGETAVEVELPCRASRRVSYLPERVGDGRSKKK